MAPKAPKSRAPKKREVYVDDVEPKYPWEKQPDESMKAFASFEVYLDIPPMDRTMRKANETLGRAWSTITGWASKHNWVPRAEAYDKQVSVKRRQKMTDDILKMHERHAKHAMLGQIAALEAIKKYVKTEENPKPKILTPNAAIRFFDIMVRIERVARGEPDSVIESKGKLEVTQPQTADQKRISMLKLLENPKAVEIMAEISGMLGTDGVEDKG